MKPRIKILRYEPHRTVMGRTDCIFTVEFGNEKCLRAFEAMCRRRPNTLCDLGVGGGVSGDKARKFIDIRVAPGS